MSFYVGKFLFGKGDVRGAIEAFELAVQSDVTNSEGWHLLGECYMDADRDTKAIECNLHALEADSSNLEAHLSLGISFTNEQDEAALHHFRAFIDGHPTYASFVDKTSGETEHERLVEMFVLATGHAPKDPQLKLALGALCCYFCKFEEAAKNFKASLELDPGNYSLWNKLGAVLANNGQHDEALGAYRQALERRPTYARAWINSGHAHYSKDNYKEACKCFLRVLSLNPEAVHVWSFVARALTSLGRLDLVPACEAHDHEAFRGEFQYDED